MNSEKRLMRGHGGGERKRPAASHLSFWRLGEVSMNRTELIERVRTAYYTADGSTLSDPEALIDFAIRNAFCEILRARRSGEAVTIHGFGSWTVQTQAERPRFNVNTREIHAARPREVIRFNLASANPKAKTADDPYGMPSEYKTDEDIMKWLITAAGSI